MSTKLVLLLYRGLIQAIRQVQRAPTPISTAVRNGVVRNNATSQFAIQLQTRSSGHPDIEISPSQLNDFYKKVPSSKKKHILQYLDMYRGSHRKLAEDLLDKYGMRPEHTQPQSLEATVKKRFREYNVNHSLDYGFKVFQALNNLCSMLEMLNATGGFLPVTRSNEISFFVGQILMHSTYGECVVYGSDPVCLPLRKKF